MIPEKQEKKKKTQAWSVSQKLTRRDTREERQRGHFPTRCVCGRLVASDVLMNYTDNASDKTMSKLVESNRENNEGYFPKMPKHINDLFV